PTSDPNDLIGTIGAIFSNSTGVQGVVTFSQERGAPGQVDFISINVKISKGLTKGKSYPWHIHQNPASANGQCGSVGNHFDPLMINQSSLYKCQKNNPNAFQATCELGDLAGKLGNLNVTADDGSFSGTFSDPSIPIDGTNTIVNRSLVIHVPNTKNVLACATI
ncbi:superoxide dismutase, partial [Dimargaris cristalligena]